MTWQQQGSGFFQSYNSPLVGYRGTTPYAIVDGEFMYYGYPATPTPLPTDTATATSAPTDTPLPTDTPWPTSTPSPTDTPWPTRTPAPGATATPNRTRATAIVTPTISGSSGGAATDTPTPSELPGATDTPLPDFGAADTPTPPVTSSTHEVRPAVRCHASTLQEVVACVEPSILRVEVHLPDGDAQGTSFVVRSDSSGTYLLTNRHVIDGAIPSKVRLVAPDGTATYTVKQIVANTAASGTAGDLAILRIAPTRLRPLAFGNSASLKAGQTVASIGYGLAFQLAGPPSVTEGIVSAVGRDLNDGFGPVWIQHQSTINHGDSGGPLLDLHGNVVGVNTLSFDQAAGESGAEPVQGIFFAIAAHLAQTIAQRLIAQAQRAFTILRAMAPSISRVTIAGFAITLPRGWLTSRLTRQNPIFSARDQLVQMRVTAMPLYQFLKDRLHEEGESGRSQ